MEYVANTCIVAFTLRAVGQDTFEDVVVPDTPAGPAKTPLNPASKGVQ